MALVANWKLKIRFYLLFYAGIWKIVATVSLLIALPFEGGFYEKGRMFAFCYPTLGLAAAAVIFESVRKGEYVFFYHGGCGRKELWLFSFVVSLVIGTLLKILLILWK